MAKELAQTWHDFVKIFKCPKDSEAIKAWKFVMGLTLTAVNLLLSIFVLPLIIQLIRLFR